MKEKKTYITTDGWEFEDKEDAQKHEDELTRYKNNAKTIITLKNGKTLSHDEVEEYFKTIKCANCPFTKECKNFYNYLRRYTTSSVCLCEPFKGEL